MTLPLALTAGEPAGIGGEITLQAWRARRGGATPFFVIDDPARLERLAASLGWIVPVAPIASPEEAARVFDRALPVLPLAFAAPIAIGRPDKRNAAAVIQSIATAVRLVQARRAVALVTNPIQKETLYQAGFPHPGHTEFLGELAGGMRAVMMLVCPSLRVVPVTVHVALRAALDALTSDEIVAVGRVAAAALTRDFGIARPRLAVAGLNPHAGEHGTMGREDIETIEPAIAALRALGIDAHGPVPPDTMFHAAARQHYDAALCMYHDQALIPLKTIDFDGGINVTLGLPFVRTSPDHGTACDIAGQGIANPASLIAALDLAGEMAERRAGAASLVG
jgi:4-hydroxythreonine-4-phosphate dehydrogenase